MADPARLTTIQGEAHVLSLERRLAAAENVVEAARTALSLRSTFDLEHYRVVKYLVSNNQARRVLGDALAAYDKHDQTTRGDTNE